MAEPVAATIYASQLISQKEGYPLWDPDPHTEPAVEIADVGYVETGAWVRLFNSSKSLGDTSNKLGVPDGYGPLQIGAILERTSLPAHVPIQSESVLRLGAQATIAGGAFTPASGGFSFECSKDQGAVLLLGDDANRRDALHKHAFIRYIRENHATWLDFANQTHERGIALNDLLLVTGCDKTSAWACAAFSAKSSQAGVSLNVGQTGIIQGGVSLSWAWKNCSSVATRSGPRRLVTPSLPAPHASNDRPVRTNDGGVVLEHVPGTFTSSMPTTEADGDVIMTRARDTVELAPPPTRDQCVFLRGYKMCDRNTWIARRLWKKKKQTYDGFFHVSHKDDGKGPGSGPSKPRDPPAGPSSDSNGSQSSPKGDGESGASSGPDSGEPEQRGPSESSDVDSLSVEDLDHEIDEDLDLYMQLNYDKELTGLEILLDYILEKSTVELALVHDDDLITLSQNIHSVNHFEGWIREIAPRIFVDNNQVGMLETTYQLSLSHTKDLQPTSNLRSMRSMAEYGYNLGSDHPPSSQVPGHNSSQVIHSTSSASVTFKPKTRLSHQRHSFAAYNLQFDPQSQLKSPYTQSYPSPTQGQTGPFNPQKRETPQRGYFRFEPQIRLSRPPRSFAAHNPQFHPQLQVQSQFVQSNVPSSPSRPHPGRSNPQEQGNPRGGHFRFDVEMEEEEEEEDSQQGRKGQGKGRMGGARAPGACDPCKQSKVKCVFPNPGAKCRRCAHGGHDCRVSGRKQKPRLPSHAELLVRLHEKDRVIYSLLSPQCNSHAEPAFAILSGSPFSDVTGNAGNQTDQSPNSHGASAEQDPQVIRPGILPILPVWDKRTLKHEVERRVDTWIKEAKGRIMQSAGAGKGTSEGASGDVGDATSDETYMPNLKRWSIPGEPPEYPGIPAILTRGIVTHQDVEELFEVFFDKINMYFSICDPVIHTPKRVLKTSPFLYTTISAVASRHYAPRPELYLVLLESAKRAAGAALNEVKSIEACQAYMLLGVYHPPSRTFSDDRTWLYLGLGIRMAMDLELHLPPRARPHEKAHSEQHERALLNRARVWLNCFCNDQSISTQLGKPSAIQIPAHKAIPFDLKRWWRSSEYNSTCDIHMCAYASLLQVMSRFNDVVYSDAYSADGVKKKLDLQLVKSHTDTITAVEEDWKRLLAENLAKKPSVFLRWRDNLWPFVVSYAKLVVLSIGLQHGLRQGLRHDNPFSDQCIDAASEVLKCVIDKLAKLGYFRYSVEAYFLFTGFAAAFLLKILRPKFSFMIRPGREQEIIELVQRLIDLFGSDEVAINNRHTPKLYSRFLANVLTKHKHAKTIKDSQPSQPSTSAAENRHMSPSVAMDAEPGLVFPSAQLGYPPVGSMAPSSTMLPDHPWGYDMYQSSSPYMDVDKPLAMGEQIPQDMMLASMSAITDPQFWEQGTMPGFSWMTSAQSWSMAVDEQNGVPRTPPS